MLMGFARRALMAVSLGVVFGGGGISNQAAAQSTNWTAEIIQLQPAQPGTARPLAVAVALDPEGRNLAIAGDDHVIRIWNLAQRQVARRLVGHTDWVRSLAYSSDGSQLASAGNDGRVLLWDTITDRPQRELVRCDQALSAVAFRPHSARLVSIGFHEPLRQFDTETGQQLEELACPCIDMRAIAFSPSDGLMAAGGRNGKIRIWDPATGTIIRDDAAHRRRIRDIRFSPDGSWLASCGEDRLVRVAAVDGSDAFNLPQGKAKVMSLAFVGPNRLATGGSDNVIRIWDLATRQEVDQLVGHTGSVMALAYRENTLVSTGFDATVRLWRLQLDAASDTRTPRTRVGKLDIFEIR